MYAGILAHMLTQELHAYVHQFCCIQRAAPLLRCARRMGRYTGKDVFLLYACHAATGDHLIYVVGVPCERGVKLGPFVFAGEKRLRCAALFTWAAIEYYRAALACGFKILLYGYCRAERTCAQQIVPAAVPVRVAGDGLFHRCAALLTKAGERIVFGKYTYYGMAAAICAGDGSFY